VITLRQAISLRANKPILSVSFHSSSTPARENRTSFSVSLRCWLAGNVVIGLGA
jgi:hypothetical protein